MDDLEALFYITVGIVWGFALSTLGRAVDELVRSRRELIRHRKTGEQLVQKIDELREQMDLVRIKP